MTKFILLGGYLSKATDGGKAFIEELVTGHGESPKVLICLFARLQEFWPDIFAREEQSFKAYLPDKTPELRLAKHDIFVEQVRWADVVYFRGGSSEAMTESLVERPEWKKDLAGKTIAGSSAGADALSTYYYGLDTREVRSGTGLLPIKMIPHFKSDYHGWEFDWDKAEAELKAYKEDLPIMALREGEFKVFNR